MAYPMQPGAPPMPAAMPSPIMGGTDQDDTAPKLSHAEVHYGMAKKNGDRCSACMHFRGKDNCEIVQPPIYPAGWCEKFQAKGAGAAASGEAAEEAAERKPTAQSPMMHGRAIAGAKALHAVGHISQPERDKHIGKSQAALKNMGAKPRKPFGSWAQ